jgi:outer membrane immunogenic protein
MRLLRVGVFAVAVSISAMAKADGPGQRYAQPAYYGTYNWSGLYIGGFVGEAWGNSVATSDPCIVNVGGAFPQGSCYEVTGGGFAIPGTGPLYAPASYSLGNGPIAGITAGYNHQVGRLVLGLESETGYIHLSGSGPFIAAPNAGIGVPNGCPPFVGNCPNFTASSTLGNWYTAVTARIGVTGNSLFPSWIDGDRSLFYAKVGPAVGRFSTSATSFNTPTTTGSYQFATSGADNVWGVAAGGGLEWALTRNWSLKGEYEYLGFQHSTTACGTLNNGSVFVFGGGVPNGPVIPATTVCGSTSAPSVQSVRLGLNYRFSSW